MASKAEPTASRSIPGRIAIALAAAVVGGALSLAESMYLFALWAELDWRRPVAEWMVEFGFGTRLAAWWGLVWIHVPDWSLACITGMCLGLILRRDWLLGVIPCAVAFVLAPELLLLFAGVDSPTIWFGPHVQLRLFLWRLSTFFVFAVSGYVSSRWSHSDESPLRRR